MLTEELQERIDLIKHKLKYIEQRPTVACIETLQPLTLAGNTIPQLVGIAGGVSVLTEADKPSANVGWEDIEHYNPDIIVLMPTGYTIEQTIKAVATLLQVPGFTNLKAVKNNRLYIADGNNYFKNADVNRVNFVELLAEIINPRQFIFGYEGEGWIKFSV